MRGAFLGLLLAVELHRIDEPSRRGRSAPRGRAAARRRCPLSHHHGHLQHVEVPELAQQLEAGPPLRRRKHEAQGIRAQGDRGFGVLAPRDSADLHERPSAPLPRAQPRPEIRCRADRRRPGEPAPSRWIASPSRRPARRKTRRRARSGRPPRTGRRTRRRAASSSPPAGAARAGCGEVNREGGKVPAVDPGELGSEAPAAHRRPPHRAPPRAPPAPAAWRRRAGLESVPHRAAVR